MSNHVDDKEIKEFKKFSNDVIRGILVSWGIFILFCVLVGLGGAAALIWWIKYMFFAAAAI